MDQLPCCQLILPLSALRYQSYENLLFNFVIVFKCFRLSLCIFCTFLFYMYFWQVQELLQMDLIKSAVKFKYTGFCWFFRLLISCNILGTFNTVQHLLN